ncbi:hypothetical protein LTR56_022755 [Elasticomyces elasticus]|nr:hypothetical protein LTR56_022755 [Elasticomyces elasticus]KAK3627817.1 hypothetical protein LTR22_022589 [Elasticomyces elasticus]KAK4907913.1 hypothetical protein LTR49_023116 [Elasticomyces elasticus]KAK5748041.1 hypothetical protein LTS12_021901 [Elasticomyces elasticus]
MTISYPQYLDILGIAVGAKTHVRKKYLFDYVCKTILPKLAPYLIMQKELNDRNHKSLSFTTIWRRLEGRQEEKFDCERPDWSQFDRTDVCCLAVVRTMTALRNAWKLTEEYGCSVEVLPKFPDRKQDYRLEAEWAYKGFLSFIISTINLPDGFLHETRDQGVGFQALETAKKEFLAANPGFKQHLLRIMPEDRLGPKHGRAVSSAQSNRHENAAALDSDEEPENSEVQPSRAEKRRRLSCVEDVLEREESTVANSSTNFDALSGQTGGVFSSTEARDSDDVAPRSKLSATFLVGRSALAMHSSEQSDPNHNIGGALRREASAASLSERPILAVRSRQRHLLSSDIGEANPAPAPAYPGRTSGENNAALSNSIEIEVNDSTSQHGPTDDNEFISPEAASDARLRTVPLAEVPMEDLVATAIEREDSTTASSPAIQSEVDAGREGTEEAVKVKLEADSTTQQLLDIHEENAALEKAVEELSREKDKVQLEVQETRNTALKRTLAKLQGQIDAMKGVNQEVIEIDDD